MGNWKTNTVTRFGPFLPFLDTSRCCGAFVAALKPSASGNRGFKEDSSAASGWLGRTRLGKTPVAGCRNPVQSVEV